MARYYFRCPDEIFDVAQHLAQEFPNAQNVAVGIYELLLNAVEHGNLGISGKHKDIFLRQGIFGREIERLLAIPENKEKYVEVEAVKDACFVRVTIQDQGGGFDWKAQLSAPADQGSFHGRGLLLAMLCGFDAVAYNAAGNSVTCYVRCGRACAPQECDYAANAPACEKTGCPKAVYFGKVK